MKLPPIVRAALSLSALGALAAVSACQSSPGQSTRIGDNRGAHSLDPTPLAIWRPGDRAPRLDRGNEVEEDGSPRREVGPPPPGYWKTIGDEVPNWEPGMASVRAGLTWVAIGPQPITGEFWSGGGNASGRVVSIAPHPVDPLTCYIASASGGLWKTVDAGVTWLPLTDGLATLNHGVVAVSLSNPDTVITSTGEYTTSSTGAGVFRSDDAGATWRRIGTASQTGSRGSGLTIHPTNPDIVHVTSTLGYRRTEDGGATWPGAAGGLPTGDCSSLVMDPQNPDILYVARRGDGIYRSANGGLNFSRLSGGLPSAGFTRIVMAISASDPQVLYAAYINFDAGLEGLYKTTTSGATWTKLPNTPNFPTPQGWYDCFVGVDPLDADVVYCGGVSPDYGEGGVIKSIDGGDTWIDITKYPTGWIHPDMHAVAFGPSGTVWIGCDGGVWKSDTAGLNFENCNAGLQVSQHYGISLHPTDPNIMIGGTQDNGTPGKRDAELPWPQIVEGDGGFSAFDFEEPTRFYTTFQYLRILRFAGTSIDDITGPWYSGGAPIEPIGFISPLVMDPNDPGTLLAGTWRLWRTQDARGDAVWQSISDANFDPGEALTAIAVALGDSDTIYVGTSSGRVLVTEDAATWTEAIPPPPSSTVISDIIVRPGVPGTAYVSLGLAVGARVVRTTDYGETWQDVSDGLPDGPRVTALAIDWAASPPTIIAGTGSGVYISRDDGASYTKETGTLPNVNIGDLAIRGRTIVAGTYGRGTWRANLDGAGACEPPVILTQPNPAHACIGGTATLTVEVSGTDPQFQWYKDDLPLFGATGSVLAFEPLDADDPGVYTCEVSNECGLVISEPATVAVDNLVAIAQPENITICESALLVAFTFEVAGGDPISYQWRHNGQDIPGATGATLVILTPGPDDAGVYVCIASNDCGDLISQPASLAVLTEPVILATQPGPCTLPPFSSVQLAVDATGSQPLQYQWLLNGEAIPGATSDTYLVQVLNPGDLYSVRVANLCGSVFADIPLSVGCAADVNGDGVVDFIDYLEFLNFYDTLDPRADINCDGILDFGDYLEFLNHYDAGC